MLKFNVCLNQGNEALQTGKSITANEVCETADNKFVAHHVELHTRGLITEDIAKIVLDNFCETVAELVGLILPRSSSRQSSKRWSLKCAWESIILPGAAG